VQAVDDERLPDVLRVCREALARQGAERDAYLDAACGVDAGLRRGVESLLAQPSEAGAFLDTTPWPRARLLAPGSRLGPYEILSLVGEGGMGQVYRARDTRLGRLIAVKVLSPEVAADAGRRARFEREAKTIARLNHARVCTLHDVGDEAGVSFLVMEYVEGRTLAELLEQGTPPVAEALRIAVEIADGLSAAHRNGVIHRDLKPANVMIAPDGGVKVLDFGIATSAGGVALSAGPDRSQRSEHPALTGVADQPSLTRAGVVVGTAPYMSPEQVERARLDARSDVFSAGAVLYELFTGKRAFQRDSPAATLAAIRCDSPAPPRSLRPELPRGVEAVVARCLEKMPTRRYASAVDLHDALLACQSQLAARRSSLWGLVRQPRLAIPALAVVAACVTAVSWSVWRWSGVRWARTVALPRIERLLDEGRGCAALRLAARVERYLPGDPEISRVRQNWTRRVSFESNPPGADVYVRDYLDTSAGAPEDYLGRTPLESVLVPAGNLRYRITKPGFAAAEGCTASGVTGGSRDQVRVRLFAEGVAAAGMVCVLAAEPIGNFWLDKYEVTNRRFKEFVDRAGYENAELWTQPFLSNGQPVSRSEAISAFKDATGRPGPATWTRGVFPDGQGDHPVSGVSWYEAAAFCASEGKALPTVHHWRAAAVQPTFATILQASNFSGLGTDRVGRRGGLGPSGTYDAAGNVREWCLNASGQKRYILGGAWNDPKYLFYMPDARPPFDRSEGNGFRCARYDREPAAELAAPLDYSPLAGRRTEAPVNDTVFQTYRAIHTYQHGPLDASSESIDDRSLYGRIEKVSFRAGYGNERVTAYLFLPTNAEPPFQTVLHFPGGYAFDIRSSARLETQWFDFLVRSGRAVMHPVYKGTYERTIGGDFATYLSQPAVFRDLALDWFKDLGRSLDYLEGRADIDRQRIAYQGISVGAAQGPRFMALEPRLKAGLLFWGGLGWASAEVRSLNYAPRSTAPTLMVNGRADLIFPWESSQRPMFRLLGARESDKRHLVLEDAGHVALNQDVVRESVAWLDRYLGPVRMRR
jgi:serine/threonine protein kinase/dienelactone hydrolase